MSYRPKILTTKGDLFTFSSLLARLGVGSDGQVLTAASGQTTGLQWAAAGGGLTQMAKVVAAGSSGTLDATGLSGAYTSIWFEYVGRFSEAVTDDFILLRLNGDTGANYYDMQIQQNNTTLSQQVLVGQTKLVYDLNANTAPTNIPSILTGQIPLYAGTTFSKIVQARAAMNTALTAAGSYQFFKSGIWNPATPAAVTQVTLTTPSGNFVAGSTLTVWGLT